MIQQLVAPSERCSAACTIVEGPSHRVFADILADRSDLSSVYILSRCTLDMPRKAFHTCSFNQMLVISPSNLGGLVRSRLLLFHQRLLSLFNLKTLMLARGPYAFVLFRCYGSPEADNNSQPCYHSLTDAITPLQEIILVNERFSLASALLLTSYSLFILLISMCSVAFWCKGGYLSGNLTDNSSAATRIVSSERGLASCSVLMTAIRSWVISSTSFCGKERI
ncbi:hypothetical protein LINPERHAP1_LOCUS35120 [Linum perenne]